MLNWLLKEIESATKLWEKICDWSNRDNNKSTDSVVTRFVGMFENHGVHRNQIPRFLGYGLTIADVKDDETLLPKLTEEILNTACDKFSIRREWLDGAEAKIHPDHDFYKSPEEFLVLLEDLIENNPDERIQGVVIAPNENEFGADALLILQETIGWIGDKPIYRYHLCNNWAFTYWKARAYLTACIAIAWKRNIYIHGIVKPKTFIDELAYGSTLLGWKGEGIWELGHKDWDPEDMALQPESFLDRVDPEKDDFGLKSALHLWLKLEKDGLMESGFGPAPRESFENALLEIDGVRLD